MKQEDYIDTKSITCCFSGHRKIPKDNYPFIQSNLRTAVVNNIEKGYRFFETGGALGFDTIAAQIVLELKETYPQIRLILVLPCVTQTKSWLKDDIDEYNRIKELADEVVYTSKEYSKGCMHKRNRYLVDHSTLCICYLTENKGGTAYTVKYAESKGVSVINIAKSQDD